MTDAQAILGLDPATATGWAHSSGLSGTWELEGPPGQRMHELRCCIIKIAREHGLSLVACEDASFGAGPEQMRTMAFHNQLRGVIVLTAWELKLPPVVFYVPATIKKFATGNGRAKKAQMMQAFRTHFGRLPIDSNEADARFVLEMARQNYQPATKPKRKGKAPKARRKEMLF